MIEVNSFAELRTTAPAKSGDIALLKRYYDKDSTFRGGGNFVGFVTTTLPSDDGGTVATGSGFYWKRIVNDLEEVNLYHFGARGDGTTDDSGAFKLMMNWAQSFSASKDLGVRFPGGKFLIKPIDLSASEMPFFYIYGDDNPLGGLPRTTIVSDKSTNPVFKVQARRTTIKGICWNGQATADLTTNKGAITAAMCTNQQPFFENTTVGGEIVRINCFRAQNNGGTVIKLLDTLDTKFDQIYTLNTYGRVFDVGWSDTVKGVWDHSTAVELTNSNFQYGYGDATLMIPRSGQGVISNVWIEHTRFPGDLSNGQWIIDALSLEDCDNPMNLDQSRVQLRQLNLQSGASISQGTTTPRWLSGYESGWRRDENFGTVMTGSMRSGWYSGYKVTNTSTSDKWYKLGKVFMPKDNQQWIIEMVGKVSNDAVTGTAGSPVTSVSSCTSYLGISRCATAIYADIRHHGTPAVLDIKYNRIGVTTSEIWVKLKAGSGDTMFNLKSTGPTRFESGECSLFTPDLTETTDLTTIGTSTPAARMSLHNGLAGIGANEKGVLTLATTAATAPTGTTAAGYITVNINGTDRKIAYY